MQASYLRWNTVTAELPPGVHAVLKDVLDLVAAGDVQIVYNRDYSSNHPCLINSVGSMLKVGGGNGIPMQHFAPLVAEFDRINTYLGDKGVNDGTFVSPLAAEILLRYYGPARPVKDSSVTEEQHMEKFASNFPMDANLEQRAKDFINSLEVDCFVSDVEGANATTTPAS